MDRSDQTFFAELASFSGQDFGYQPPGAPLNWQKCLDDWSEVYARKLVKLRGFTLEFVNWLHDEAKGVGVQYDGIVFPVIGPGGAVVGLHRYCEDGKLKFSKGCKVSPLVFGDMSGVISEIHIHESRWDCYALASVTGWYLKPGIRFLSTLGGGNGKLVSDQIPRGARVYCWAQNDSPDQTGRIPNQEWFKAVAANADCEIFKVEVPLEHKDLNDWIKAGGIAIEFELEAAREIAQPYNGSSPQTAQAPPPEPASTLFPALALLNAAAGR